MNKVFLSGRIATEPQLRTENGDAAHLALLLSVQHKTRAGEVRREAYRVNAWHDVALCKESASAAISPSARSTPEVSQRWQRKWWPKKFCPRTQRRALPPPRKRRPSRTNLPRLAPRQWRKREKADQRHGGKP